MKVLDTDILIDVLRGHTPALTWFAEQRELPAVPGFVVMELIQDASNKARVDKALKLVEPLQVIWPSQVECLWAMNVFRAFHLSHGLGLLDSLIAACAVGREATLLTFNGKHYRPLPELELEEPYSRT
jgi:predicted nucleic acid-binding protein